MALYATVFSRLHIMLREDDQLLRARLAPLLHGDQRLCTAPHAGEGMGATLADGITTVADWDYVLIGLADMPFVQQSTLIQIKATLEATNAAAIVQPMFGDRPGHPVGFGRAFFPELARLQGDAGARSVVQGHRDALQHCFTDDAGVVRDIDAPDDLR